MYLGTQLTSGPPRTFVCVWFLVIWFGHSNVWWTSPPPSQWRININTHTQYQSKVSVSKLLTGKCTTFLHFHSYYWKVLLLSSFDSSHNLHPQIYDKTRIMWEQRDPPKVRTANKMTELGNDLCPSPSALPDPQKEAKGRKVIPSWSECVVAAQQFPRPWVPRSSTRSPPRH